MIEIDKSLPKKERILLAAADVFARKGYVQSSLDEIIELADTGKGTVYNYFKNKENLFYTLAESINEPFIAELQNIYDNDQPIPIKLEKYLKTMIDFLKNNDTLWQVLFYEMLGANKGWYFIDDYEDKDPKVIVKWGNKPSEEELVRVKKYYLLASSSLKILDQILLDGVNQGFFKEKCDTKGIHFVARHLYGGICMTVFFANGDLKSTPELSSIITERFLYGFAEVRN